MNQKEYIGKTIRRYREDRLGVSADRLGEMLEPPKSGKTVLSWERGRTEPDGNTLIQLCVIFGAKIGDFYYKPADYFLVSLGGEEDDGWTEAPLLGSVAAGVPLEMVPTDTPCPAPAAIRSRFPKGFFLKIKGESVNRVLCNGSYAYINPTSEVVDGKLYAVAVNGDEATVKRVQRLENGIKLCPDSNDPTFRDMIFDYNDPETKTVTVIGRVVWCMFPFDYDF